MHQFFPAFKCDVRQIPEILGYDMQQKGVKQIQELGQKQILGEKILLIVAPHGTFTLRHITPRKRGSCCILQLV